MAIAVVGTPEERKIAITNLLGQLLKVGGVSITLFSIYMTIMSTLLFLVVLTTSFALLWVPLIGIMVVITGILLLCIIIWLIGSIIAIVKGIMKTYELIPYENIFTWASRIGILFLLSWSYVFRSM